MKDFLKGFLSTIALSAAFIGATVAFADFHPSASVTLTVPTGISSTTPWAALSVNPTAGTASNEFVVGSSTATHFIINNSGAVGVGTTSPWANFAINPVAGRASNQFAIGSSSATSLLVNNSGFVGIGTTSPWALFSINPTAGLSVPAFAIGSSTQTSLQVTNGGQTATCLTTVNPTSTAMTIDWTGTCPEIDIKIGTSATTITFINATTSNMAGSRKLINVWNPGGSAGALTWVGVEWYAATQPTQTTTSNQGDSWAFHVSSATSTLASPTYKVFGAISAGAQ